MTETAGGSHAAFEELLQFLYLAPVGIVKFSAEGTVDLINPMAAQILLPLLPEGDLAKLYVSLAILVPDLRQRVGDFADNSGAILDQQRLETRVGDETLVLALTVNRVNETVYMAVVKDVTKLAEQELKTPLICQTDPKTSAKSGWSCSI